MNTHFVIDGNQLTGSHPDLESAKASAILQAKKGKTVTIAQLLETVGSKTEIVVTAADGTKTVID